MNEDKAGKPYWDSIWQDKPLPRAMNPRELGLGNYVQRKFHGYFCQVFSRMDTRGKRLLEIGCARSAWLPYFAKEFDFRVWGIDYSEMGCQQARQILFNEDVEGEVVCADLLAPPESLVGKFDVVVSFGVAEHFQNTTACIAAFAKFLKPGGLMLTSVPNMAGLLGQAQKIINRSVYAIHAPLNRDALAEAHRRNDLKIISSEYMLFINLSVINMEHWTGKFFYQTAVRLVAWISKGVWAMDRVIPIFKPNRWTSPYIICVAMKRES